MGDTNNRLTPNIIPFFSGTDLKFLTTGNF
jgi:hypothetical protein